MIQDIGAGRYHNEYKNCRPDKNSQVICCRGREIFVAKREQEPTAEEENGKEKECASEITFPSYDQVIAAFPQLEGKETYLFSIDEVSYFLFREENGEELVRQAQEVFRGFGWERMELLRTAYPRERAFAGVTGMQLANWYAGHRFCPQCGTRLLHSEKERMLFCPSCRRTEYPKISPAVIVGVTDGDEILLTKYAGRAFTKYALIAGFAEIGESIEDTVRREVMEEVGLKVKNLRYYKSQPWSFSDTLLMGFFVQVDGDRTVRLDRTELSVATWCKREDVPQDDGLILTREKMRVFRENRRI